MKLYLASSNLHKAKEFQILAQASGLEIEVISARTIGGMPEVAEDTGTFLGNARKKAWALKSSIPAENWVLADDSGLCVDALGGQPGVESAYYAGPEGNSAANLKKLVETMREVPAEKRGAHFLCLLFLIDGSGVEHVFEGRCEGRLLFEPRGGEGFGYDPLIVLIGQEKSLAEMTEVEKNAISHRGIAARKLFEWCRQQSAVE